MKRLWHKRERYEEAIRTNRFLKNYLQAFLYDNDDRFFPGWKLDSSWYLCTISWSTMILLGCGLTSAALLLPSEGGYELIPDDECN